MSENTALITEPPVAVDSTLPWQVRVIQAAIANNVPAAELEKLTAMAERWERNQAEKEFNAAMHACQEEMPKVIRTAENTQTRSRYAPLESIQEATRPVYSRHGFAISYGEADCPVPGFKRTVCDVRHSGGHCARYHLDLPVDGVGPKGNAIGGMNAVQGCISTTSYGQRRLLCMVFNITLAGEDDDGQAADVITAEQVAEINDLLVAINTTKGDFTRFLAWLKVPSLDKIPARKYDDAIKFLSRKKAAT